MNETEARDLLGRVLARIAPEVELSMAGDDERMQDAFDLDSMDFLDLVTGIEEESGVTIPDADYANVSTIAGLVNYLTERSP